MAKYVGLKQGKVHESHVISEYYCGGCGWPVTDHDSFCPECGGAFRECDASNLEDENAKLRELVVALYHIHFGTEKESWDAWEDFCPCGICEERHGGEAPCAYTAKDLADECCEPITKEIVIDRMRELRMDVE